MKKSLFALALLVCATGCTPDLVALARAQAALAAGGGAGATASPAPGASPVAGANPSAGGGVTVSGTLTLSNAQMDSLIACANTKGSVGASVAAGWTYMKSTPESARGALATAVEIQAKAIGCR